MTNEIEDFGSFCTKDDPRVPEALHERLPSLMEGWQAVLSRTYVNGALPEATDRAGVIRTKEAMSELLAEIETTFHGYGLDESPKLVISELCDILFFRCQMKVVLKEFGSAKADVAKGLSRATFLRRSTSDENDVPSMQELQLIWMRADCHDGVTAGNGCPPTTASLVNSST